MSYYAKVIDQTVVSVIVAEQDLIDSGVLGAAHFWIKTCKQGSIRKNYAGIGYTYDAQRDAFIAPRRYPSWVLNENTCQWEAPIPYPSDGKRYWWHEDVTQWLGYPTQPYPSWTLNVATNKWEAPIPYPADGKRYTWDETTQSWIERQ